MYSLGTPTILLLVVASSQKECQALDTILLKQLHLQIHTCMCGQMFTLEPSFFFPVHLMSCCSQLTVS